MRSNPPPAPARDDLSASPVPLPLAGGSLPAQRARAAFEDAARASAPVLLVAESGLRTDSVATAVHRRARRNQPFVAVDCAAADAVTLEAALFGAPARRASRDAIDVVSPSAAIIRAGGGTLYLQHVLDLPAGLQRRLARILRDAEVRAGGRRVSIRCHVIAAASPAITTEVEEGHFRADLYRRLARVAVTIPALRDRAEDIPELTARLSAELAEGREVVFTHAAMTVLGAPSWTGNLDELEAVLRRIVHAGIPGPVRQEDVLAHIPLDGHFLRVPPQVSLREARRQFEREYIASVLERHRWRMSDAAQTLGIERANLYRKTRQLGITRRTRTPAAS
jgi:DNA-binding NtrC family response regulator